MFHSATMKLTGWYLLILMVISVVFSVTIYQVMSREVDSRFELLHAALKTEDNNSYSSNELSEGMSEASEHLIIELFYANLVILFGGGVASYLLARRTLRPIQEAHESQSRFTSDASHELRTPLAVMKTELEVALRDESISKSELRSVLSSNLEEVEKLSILSEMLLNLSRLDHDKLERKAVDIYSVTVDILHLYHHPSTRTKISADKHPLIDGNQPAINELVSILIDNAIKYSPQDSQVNITISQRGRQVCFEISNHGPGIDSKRLPYIFDRFYQADPSRGSGDKKGFGLGLALAKKIVDLHNGELTASSGINQITVFTVLLPLYQKRSN